MSVNEAYQYSRLCRTLFAQENPRHESAFYEPWDYILKAMFPLSEGYVVAGQLALIDRNAYTSQGLTPDFVVCTKQGLGYRRVSFMAVEIKNIDENQNAAEKQLFEYMNLLATKFEIQGQEAVYGLLCIGFTWHVYQLTIAGRPKPFGVGEWMSDFTSVSSLRFLRKLKREIAPVVAEAVELSQAHGEVRSSASPSSSTSPPPPMGSPALSPSPKGDADSEGQDVPEASSSPHRSVRSIDSPAESSKPQDDFFSKYQLSQQFSATPHSSIEPSVQSVPSKDIARGPNPPSTQPPDPSRSSRMERPIQSIKPKGGPRGNNPSSKQSSTTTSHQSMTKSVEPKGAPQAENPSSFSGSSIATPHGGKANDADVRDSPDPLDLLRPGNGNRGRSQRPMGNALTSRRPSARRPRAESDDGSSPDELDFFRSDDRRRRLEKEMTDPTSSSGPSGSKPHIPEVGSDPVNIGPSAPKHPVFKVESKLNVRPGDGNSSLNPKHPKK